MSKFLKVLMVVALVAAMVAPAVAEDRLGLSGQFRVRAWALDDGTDTSSFMDQRFRMGAKISVAEGVTLNLRTDITETTWGDGGSEYGSGRMGDTQQWDRAYVDLNKGNIHFRAGQQYAGFGMLSGTVNSQDAGLRVDVKGPIAFSAFWLLDDQRGGTTTADSYLTAARVSHKTDNYSANLFVANQTKALNDREGAYLVGLNLKTKLSAVALKGELGFFTGDASETVDAVGTQLFLDASMAASDTATVGGQFYYAASADAGEMQYTHLGNDFNGHDPIMDLGTSLSNEKMTFNRPEDFTGTGAGVIGGRIYANLKASDALDLGASFAYLIPEDDANTVTAGNKVDSTYALAAAASYKVMANTKLQAQVQYVDTDDALNSDAETQVGAGLYVNW